MRSLGKPQFHIEHPRKGSDMDKCETFRLRTAAGNESAVHAGDKRIMMICMQTEYEFVHSEVVSIRCLSRGDKEKGE